MLAKQACNQHTVFIFDEIGKMELLSKDFVARVKRLLENPDPKLHVLGTVAIAGGGFISQSKRLSGVEVVEIDVQNRDEKVRVHCHSLLATLASAPKSPRGAKLLAGWGARSPLRGGLRWRSSGRPRTGSLLGSVSSVGRVGSVLALVARRTNQRPLAAQGETG